MSKNRVAGRLYFKVDGQQHNVKAGITYNLGKPKRETISTAAHKHLYKETPKVPFIAGELIDTGDLDLGVFQELDGVTITAELANGKTIVLRNAWYADDGDANSEEATVGFRFEGESAEEVK